MLGNSIRKYDRQAKIYLVPYIGYSFQSSDNIEKEWVGKRTPIKVVINSSVEYGHLRDTVKDIISENEFKAIEGKEGISLYRMRDYLYE